MVNWAGDKKARSVGGKPELIYRFVPSDTRQQSSVRVLVVPNKGGSRIFV